MSACSVETQETRPISFSSLGLSSSSSLFGSDSSSQQQPNAESLKSSKIELIESYEQRFLNSLKQLNAPNWMSGSSLKVHFKEKEMSSSNSTKAKYDRIRQRTKCGHSPSPLVSKSLNNSRAHRLDDDDDSKKSDLSEFGSKSAHSLSYSPALHRTEYRTPLMKRPQSSSVFNPRDSYLRPISRSSSALNAISPAWYKPKCLQLPQSEKASSSQERLDPGLFTFIQSISRQKSFFY